MAGEDFYCDQVLSGAITVETVLETTDVLAFRHTRPAYPVHVVVVPKRHVPLFTDMPPGDEPLLATVIDVVRKVARGIETEHGACRVVTNLGTYQDSKHLHFHVVSGDALGQTERG